MEIIPKKLPGEVVELPALISRKNIQCVSVRKDVGRVSSAGGEKDRERWTRCPAEVPLACVSSCSSLGFPPTATK